MVDCGAPEGSHGPHRSVYPMLGFIQSSVRWVFCLELSWEWLAYQELSVLEVIDWLFWNWVWALLFLTDMCQVHASTTTRYVYGMIVCQVLC